MGEVGGRWGGRRKVTEEKRFAGHFSLRANSTKATWPPLWTSKYYALLSPLLIPLPLTHPNGNSVKQLEYLK
jgi:hypothetical protein